MSRNIIYIAEMLTTPSKGIYTQWIYYDDGSMDTVEVPKGPILDFEIVLKQHFWDILE